MIERETRCVGKATCFWLKIIYDTMGNMEKNGPEHLGRGKTRQAGIEKGILIGMPATGLFSTCCLCSLQCYRKGAL